MQDYVTPLPLAALLAAHIACLAALFTIIATPAPVHQGWRIVGPGGTHWFCFVGAWAFGALISWVWLFVGSGRADAEFQMNVALLLSIVVTSGASAAGFYIAHLRRLALRWRGSEIRWREAGQERAQIFDDFDAIRQRFDGVFELRFKDQTVLKIDQHARNAGDFLAHFSEALGEDVY